MNKFYCVKYTCEPYGRLHTDVVNGCKYEIIKWCKWNRYNLVSCLVIKDRPIVATITLT